MGFNDWSDDENPSSRDKFRPERNFEEHDRKKRGRSPPEDGRRKRRDYRADSETQHYIPNYSRDGYSPAPRYGGRPERRHTAPQHYQYPMMDMMNPQIMNAGWHHPRVPNMDPTQLDYLVPFRQFAEYTQRTSHRYVDDQDMKQLYNQYKTSFSARQLAQFFNTNKEKQWFKEKYHPAVSLDRKTDIRARRRRYLSEFLDALNRGEYDNVCYDATTEDSPEMMEQEDDEYDDRLVIKTVPPSISRESIVEMCEKVDGFDYLALSDPSPTKKFHRIGWIKFKPGTDMQKAFDQLDNQTIDDFVFHFAMTRKNSSHSRQPRTAPEITNTTDRLHKDLEQAKQVALAFDAELHEEGLAAVEAYLLKHPVSEDERLNLKKNLDLTISYLKHVHMYCYYCALECDSIEDLFKRCPDTHCRTTVKPEEPSDPKEATKVERGIAQWVKNFDQKISLKIHTPDDEEIERLGGRILQNEIDNYIKDHVLKETDSKYKCQVGECAKAFKGFEFVEKHILAKHSDEIARVKTDTEYFNNYALDPNHYVPSSNVNHNANLMPAMPFAQPMMLVPWGVGFNEPPPPQRRQQPRMSSSSSAIADLENSLLPRDPRQVTSYVDLDAPAEGDGNISFY